MAIAIGTKLSVKSSTTQVYHSRFLCVLTTIRYIELCLLFEFGLGKLIRAGALAAESCCQEVCLKKKYIVELPSTDTLLQKHNSGYMCTHVHKHTKEGYFCRYLLTIEGASTTRYGYLSITC